MLELVENRAKAAEFGNAAYERTKKYYDRPIMLENQRKDYETLLK